MFDVRALSLVFRAKYLSALEKFYKADQLEFHGKTRQFESAHEFKTLLICAARKNWVVYSKLPFAGPDQVLKYLSLYTHRVGISDSRILNIDESNLRVRIAYKDYAHSGKKKSSGLIWMNSFAVSVCTSYQVGLSKSATMHYCVIDTAAQICKSHVT